MENGGAQNNEEGKESAEELQEKQQTSEINLVTSLEPLIKHVNNWESSDAEYFLQTVRNHRVMTEEGENNAMAQMLQSFIDAKPLVNVMCCI